MTKAQLTFDLPFQPALGRGDFWASPSNERALAWIDRWPDWPTPVLIVYGPQASGKSHLLHVWQARSQSWAVDDVDRLIGDHDCEEKLFHAYNRIKEDGRHALMTARTPPSQWPFSLPDLRSRLVAQSTVPIEAPDDNLLRVLIIKHLADRQLDAGPEIVNYILTHVERSFAAVQDVIDKADRMALARRKTITVPLLKEILA